MSLIIRTWHNPYFQLALVLAIVALLAVGCDNGEGKPTRPFGW